MKKSSRWKHLRKSYAKERRRLTRTEALRKQIVKISNEKIPDNQVRVNAPIRFALEDKGHDQLIEFLGILRGAFLEGCKVVCIDFRQTSLMVAGGTLLFFSELHRLQRMFPHVPLRCIPSKDNVVNQVLKHLGIFEALGYDSAIVPTKPNVISWRAASSLKVDGDKIGGMLDTYESLNGAAAKQLFRGVGEAMMNAIRHAYIESRGDGLPDPDNGKWWMFCRESDGEIVVAICDLGMGIPRSLPIKHPSEAIAAVLAKIPGSPLNNDAKMIYAAMELNRTSTDVEGRGKGLSDFLRVIDDIAGAALFLFSNRGLVKYRGGLYKRLTYHGSIKGTVVLWVIPLPKSGE